MIEDHICVGDFVIVQSSVSAENGDTIVALIDNNEATLKKFFRDKNDTVRLQPANSKMKPILVREEDLKIQGRVVECEKILRIADSGMEVYATGHISRRHGCIFCFCQELFLIRPQRKAVVVGGDPTREEWFPPPPMKPASLAFTRYATGDRQTALPCAIFLPGRRNNTLILGKSISSM
jgi:hypothetical protein